jgi:hypothetical protein
MPLVLICKPGSPVPAKILTGLAKLGQPYVIECWSRKGPHCPICASPANLNRLLSRPRFWECWTCFRDFCVRFDDDGVTRSSTDDHLSRAD